MWRPTSRRSLSLSRTVIFCLAGGRHGACNVLGSFLGTHLALRHGSRFVRKVFLVMVSVFIVKFAHDTFV
jgi:uncharacterized membrane protein YfcA